MSRGRIDFKSSDWSLIAGGVLAALISVGHCQFAAAQGGQTEVSKTAPSKPVVPPAQALPQTPAVPQQTDQAAQPTQPVSPVGSGANWQANTTAPLPTAPLQETDLQVVQKVNDWFNGLTNLQGNFLQTDPDNKQKRGKFYFQRPGKVRFDYGAPSKLRIISDGKYLAIEDHDLQTSDRYPLEMTPFRLLLAEKVDLGNDAKIVSVDQGPEAVVLTVEDKKGDGSGRISLFFNKTDMSLKEWIITDPQGLDTRVEVGNLEENKEVADSLFEFSKTIGFKSLNQ
jgi:outer membrane lipoprotein-sorting protein